ncbi:MULTISPECIES: thiamine pyrophosphate-dependent dehydrogenase E1 component subunit alpha [unclassified Enterococcus]|uniref:thiamine pyrophosphate-dependent dehydrogenase E1 component subunit alpha n=1 Tax=unclassified Enterococcus TaxID=2608891 RepID=UPI001A920EF6|nr:MULTISPECIES: thiamine pyrophosphate-dependent dehydrogenase E1 component subunit alpha [unclassified Enterococcus]MBO0460229.1 thiamine pyrophosphate-dependent dehydrogenase E1 component subunit alpha [Enterococcus sp. DIV1298c]MBO1299638.1 thiamine pyrophosphate-dependent dehydrogenase E1 component subunit alpha [Enterococcus sp. DIV1271a]
MEKNKSMSIENSANLTDEDLKDIFYKMWEIRFFDEKVDELFARGLIHGTTHLAVGQEATAAGSGAVLRKTDWITSTHRGHGHTIAKGTNVNEMMAELFGRTTGTNNGKGGSMHIADLDTGNLGANGIVGGGYPIAVGAALTSKMKETNQVALSYGGDGSTNEGSFHEALNLAAIWDLPVVFFIENNKYGMSGPIEKMTRVQNLSERAKAYGIEGVTIDGNNLLEVIETTYQAVEKARRGEGPTLIEALTYRWKGHSKSDAKKYRTKQEEEQWRTERDPIERTKNTLVAAGIFTEEEAEEIRKQAKQSIVDAVKFGETSPMVAVETMYEDVYAE